MKKKNQSSRRFSDHFEGKPAKSEELLVRSPV